MNTNDFVLNAFFTTNGKDVWKLESFIMEPSCRLKNLETGKVEDFGMSGLTARSFHRILMPKEIKEEAERMAKLAKQQQNKRPSVFS